MRAKMFCVLLAAAYLLLTSGTGVGADRPPLPLKAGIIGLDGHALPWTRIIDDPKVVGCDRYGPCSLEPHHPDFFWYGIHGVEPLFTNMGTGCVSVTRVHTDGTDLAVGVWKDGRIGTFRGIRQGRGYGSTVFRTKGIVPGGAFDGYEPLIIEIVKFFKTGKAPVSEAETLEIFAFMETADESERQGGRPVALEAVLNKAQQAAANVK